MNSSKIIVNFVIASAVWSMLAVAAFARHHDDDPRSGERHSHGSVRTWTLEGNGATMRGSFHSYRDGKVRIARESGDIVALPLASLSRADRAFAETRIADVRRLNRIVDRSRANAHAESVVDPAEPFRLFSPHVKTRKDERFLYVESDGLPHAPAVHVMMVGIKSWQQQVPLPQSYGGKNSWRIPLFPELAETPISGKKYLRRGAIALAVNGVPIFNALNNRGDDAYLAGELDEFGGHSGRADDYHYHIAPLVLEKVVGKNLPIAYALDGYAIYGLIEKNPGSNAPLPCVLGSIEPLDEWNGHFEKKPDASRGVYHYHASLAYPYINGGMRGKVDVVDDQVDPQPRAEPVRPSTGPLKGATLTGFKMLAESSWELTYTLGGKTLFLRYRIEADGRFVFDFVDSAGKTTTETYEKSRRSDDRRPKKGEDRGGNGRGAGRDRGEDRPEGPNGPGVGGPDAPWIVVHAAEVDSDQDGELTRLEMLTEAEKAFAGYDVDKDGRLSREEYDQRSGARPPRSAMGGFVRVHADELDQNGDGTIQKDEMLSVAGKMFDKSDRNHDGKLSAAELEIRREKDAPESRPAKVRGDEKGGRGEKAPVPANMFFTEVPAHPYDVILVQPTETSTTASVMTDADTEVFIEYGLSGSPLSMRSEKRVARADTPESFRMDRLSPNKLYSYRLRTRRIDSAATPKSAPIDEVFEIGETSTFATKKSPGRPFIFTIQSDSHLDANMSPEVYGRALASAVADRPDFHIDLGDTFMTDKYRNFRSSLPQYFAQRYWLGQISRQAPLFMVLGNHDGENGWSADGPESMAQWSFAQRTKFFPPPTTDGVSGNFITGRTEMIGGEGAHYYAFDWGDAQIVGLDPFWATKVRGRGRDGESADENWGRTLGKEQYDWLDRTLARSPRKLKFVFIHHLVGGRGKDARGGVEASHLYEWGGKDADLSDAFAKRRPGWAMPIHDLLVRRGVSVVFHGHDHLFVKNERDGLVYQCTPQPGNERGGTRSAAEYGYETGVILGSPGYLRVRVDADRAGIEFVRSAREATRLPRTGNGKEGAERNGEIVTSYSVVGR